MNKVEVTLISWGARGCEPLCWRGAIEVLGPGRNFLAVGDEHDGCFFAAGELGDQIDDHGAGGGVEVAGGFIGEEDGGLVDEGTGECGALELAS